MAFLTGRRSMYCQCTYSDDAHNRELKSVRREAGYSRDFMGYFRHGLTFAPNYLNAALRPSCVRFASQLKHAAQAFHRPDASDPLPFAGLGLSRPVRLGLKSAFSAVTKATDAQAALIPAIIQGKDVMIKGHTGSGKYVQSFLISNDRSHLCSSRQIFRVGPGFTQ